MRRSGIRVNTVAPGVVDTPLHKDNPKDFLKTLSPMQGVPRPGNRRRRPLPDRGAAHNRGGAARRWRRTSGQMVDRGHERASRRGAAAERARHHASPTAHPLRRLCRGGEDRQSALSERHAAGRWPRAAISSDASVASCRPRTGERRRRLLASTPYPRRTRTSAGSTR